MLNQLGSSFLSATDQSQENQIIADFESMLGDLAADRDRNSRDNNHARRGWAKRLVPIVLLAGVGAALALVPIGLKPGMVTGRSVAHSGD